MSFVHGWFAHRKRFQSNPNGLKDPQHLKSIPGMQLDKMATPATPGFQLYRILFSMLKGLHSTEFPQVPRGPPYIRSPSPLKCQKTGKIHRVFGNVRASPQQKPL